MEQIVDNLEKSAVLEAIESYIPDDNAARSLRQKYMATLDEDERFRLLAEYLELDIHEVMLYTEKGAHPLYQTLESVQENYRLLRNRNYFPLKRFGSYTITVRGDDGKIEYFATHETEGERNSEAQKLRKQGHEVNLGKLSDTERSLMDMPPQVIQSVIEKLNMDEDSDLHLSDKQVEFLQEVMVANNTGKRFAKHLLSRKGIEGYSDDALRSFSTYLLDASNHIANMEYALPMKKILGDFGAAISEIDTTDMETDTTALTNLLDYFKRHQKYISSPDKDWGLLRSVGFAWYLGMNVKSAVLNFTQIPLVVYPILSHRYGDVAASKALTWAMSKGMKHIFKSSKVVDGLLSERGHQVMQHLIDESILDESLANDMATMGEEQQLDRTVAGKSAKGYAKDFAQKSAFMFRSTERANRYITALAAIKLLDADGKFKDMDAFELHKEVRNVIQQGNFEYAKWNRPEIMRGKKAALFLFKQYVQHASYLLFGGAGSQTAMRMLLVTAVVAGLQGLPFAETLMNLLDMSGANDGDARGAVRDVLSNFTDNPDMFMHGAGRYYGLGPLHTLNAIGLDIPDVDISASISLGNMVPGFEAAQRAADATPQERIGATLVDIGGPVAAMFAGLIGAIDSEDPDVWRRFEKATPVFVKNVMQAQRFASQGMRDSRGALLAEFDVSDTEHVGELVAKNFGFQPTKISTSYEKVSAQYRQGAYWMTRRQQLMKRYKFIKRQEGIDNREALADHRKAVREYNLEVGKHPELRKLRLSQKTLNDSWKKAKRMIRKREQGKATQSMLQGVYERVDQQY
jgi:hypothetical protein